MNDNTKVLVALLAGIAAGAALGILFAPERGTETRDRLNDALRDLGDSIRERAAEEIENLNEFKEKIVTNVKSKMQGAQEDFTQGAENSAI